MNTQESGDVKQTLRQFVTRSINLTDLADDDDLFESGLVNSLFAIQLMTFIEKTFGIEVDAEDLDIQNFRSLNAATSFVLKKSMATTS
jgi:methoxymalonate biosynthesis acyl carrier protein